MNGKALRKTLADVESCLSKLEASVPSFFESPMARGTKHVISVEQATLNAALGYALINIFNAYLATQGEVPDSSDVAHELTRVRDKLVKVVTVRQQQQQQQQEQEQEQQQQEEIADTTAPSISAARPNSNDGKYLLIGVFYCNLRVVTVLFASSWSSACRWQCARTFPAANGIGQSHH